MLLKGLQMFTNSVSKDRKVLCLSIIHSLHIEMFVPPFCVFRLFSTSLPPQRPVSAIPLRSRFARGAGACSRFLGLEHGLDGGNGGSVQSPLSWQEHQTLWHLTTLPGWRREQHEQIKRTSETSCSNVRTARRGEGRVCWKQFWGLSNSDMYE